MPPHTIHTRLETGTPQTGTINLFLKFFFIILGNEECGDS